MAEGQLSAGHWVPRLLNRVHARLAGVARPVTALVVQPEPKSLGDVARGRQLLAGNLLFAGHLVEAPGRMPWDVPAPDHAFEDVVQGCAWLDDLAALGTAPARALAQGWVQGWIARYGRGKGPGWTPEATGRRLIRWVHHAPMLMRAQGRAENDAFLRSLARQARFLSRRWRAAGPGLARFEALTGLLHAALSLEGLETLAGPAARGLAQECAAGIGPAGGLSSRNPEELLEVLTLLVWAAEVLTDAGRSAEPEHAAAITRAAPVLRALRHADGSLARFHGGGAGAEGWLERALAASGTRHTAESPAMGYVRLAVGRVSLVLDAGRPPAPAWSYRAHASTLAFELTAGRCPLVVNIGPGAGFGPDWRRAARATAAHSTAEVDGYSSSRFGPAVTAGSGWREPLRETPANVLLQQVHGPEGHSVTASHDGYARSHGLTHLRRLDLAPGGGQLSGEDTLYAMSEDERIRLETVLDRRGGEGIPFAIRFHLHPEVAAEAGMGGLAVSLTLGSGEVWVFRHDGAAEMSLAQGVYLDPGRVAPRATKQIVLSGRVMEYGAVVGWTLARAQDPRPAPRGTATEGGGQPLDDEA